MKLNKLKPLFNDMVKQNIYRIKFAVTINKVIFEVIYFIDDKPQSLAIGVRSENFFFEVPVNDNFTINAFLGENYRRIKEILDFSSTSTDPFSPTKFFNEINKGIPPHAIKRNVPEPHDIFLYRKNVEESDKIYFLTWRDNNLRGDNVSLKNLDKTRKLLSYEAYLMCKKKNISSCWTAEQDKVQKYSLPFN
ncbi:DUF6037 family protein [Peribacillus butanolivorans]|uniref:DUF6037 family protein n=1 Tax=Peribacillus butanolivorans TaxID=421767 RepID=UPI00363D502E